MNKMMSDVYGLATLMFIIVVATVILHYVHLKEKVEDLELLEELLKKLGGGKE